MATQRMATDWRLWFLQLSGWPVFLGVVLVAVLLTAALSVLMARLSTNRSVSGNMLLAMAGVAAVGVGLLVLMAVLTRL